MTVSRDAQGKVTFPPISNPGIFPPTCIILLFHFYSKYGGSRQKSPHGLDSWGVWVDFTCFAGKAVGKSRPAAGPIPVAGIALCRFQVYYRGCDWWVKSVIGMM